jgi:hypothetical protein
MKEQDESRLKYVVEAIMDAYVLHAHKYSAVEGLWPVELSNGRPGTSH